MQYQFLTGFAAEPTCDQDGVDFFPYPENCRKFYECDNGNLYKMTCANDWLYDINNKYCDYPERVDCGDRPLCDNDDNNCHDRKMNIGIYCIFIDFEIPLPFLTYNPDCEGKKRRQKARLKKRKKSKSFVGLADNFPKGRSSSTLA